MLKSIQTLVTLGLLGGMLMTVVPTFAAPQPPGKKAGKKGGKGGKGKGSPKKAAKKKGGGGSL